MADLRPALAALALFVAAPPLLAGRALRLLVEPEPRVLPIRNVDPAGFPLRATVTGACVDGARAVSHQVSVGTRRTVERRRAVHVTPIVAWPPDPRSPARLLMVGTGAPPGSCVRPETIDVTADDRVPVSASLRAALEREGVPVADEVEVVRRGHPTRAEAASAVVAASAVPWVGAAALLGWALPPGRAKRALAFGFAALAAAVPGVVLVPLLVAFAPAWDLSAEPAPASGGWSSPYLALTEDCGPAVAVGGSSWSAYGDPPVAVLRGEGCRGRAVVVATSPPLAAEIALRLDDRRARPPPDVVWLEPAAPLALRTLGMAAWSSLAVGGGLAWAAAAAWWLRAFRAHLRGPARRRGPPPG